MTPGDAEMHNLQWYARARRLTPFGAPIVVGVALLGLALLLTSHSIGLAQTPGTVGSVATLLSLYALLGVAWGVSLRLASTARAWSSLLLGGLMVYLVLFAAATFGAIGATLMATTLAVASYLYLRKHVTRVEEGVIAVTTVWGSYARTLDGGRHLLLPAEQIAVAYDLGEREYTTDKVHEQFMTASGTRYQASAIMRVTYKVNPAYGRTLLAMQHNWDKALRDKMLQTFQSTLREFSADILATGQPPIKGMLAGAVLAQLRREGADFGVEFMRLRIRNAELGNDQTGPLQPVSPHSSGVYSSGAYGSGAYGSQGSLGAYQSIPHGLGLHPDSLPPIAVYAPPVGATPSVPFAAAYGVGGEMLNGTSALLPYNTPYSTPVVLHDQHYNAFSADTLKESYEAIRDNRINDPQTVRAVAAAFAHVASDPQSVSDLPFDARAAAEILLGHANNLERQTLQPA